MIFGELTLLAMSTTQTALLATAAAIIIVLFTNTRIVQQKQAFVVENLGRYRATLEAGFHVLIPFLDRVVAKHSLKEQSIDTQAQEAITKDNVKITIDGIMYLQVVEPRKATYGIDNYRAAIVRLAQTTLRGEVGKLDLDQTLESRETINARVVQAVDEASDPWGVKILRYEIMEILPPQGILEAMAKQVQADRDRRAAVITSEGKRQAQINVAEGEKQAKVLAAQASKEEQSLVADGEAYAIRTVANATAEGIEKVAESLNTQGGDKAMQLRVAEQYVSEFGKIIGGSSTLVIPANMTDLAGMIATATKVVQSEAKPS